MEKSSILATQADNSARSSAKKAIESAKDDTKQEEVKSKPNIPRARTRLDKSRASIKEAAQKYRSSPMRSSLTMHTVTLVDG